MNHEQQAQSFVSVIDQQGVIWEVSSGRKRQAVGIDLQKEQEYQAQIADMQGVINNYYGKLVEVGIITPPKSPEEIAKEAAEAQLKMVQEQMEAQAKINASLIETMKEMQENMSELAQRIDEKPVEMEVVEIIPVKTSKRTRGTTK